MANETLKILRPEVYNKFLKWLRINYIEYRDYPIEELNKLFPNEASKLKDKSLFLKWANKSGDVNLSIYDMMYVDPNAGKTLTIGTEGKLPWEQVDMTEEQFSKAYPDIYATTIKFKKDTEEQMTTGKGLWWEGYTETQLAQLASLRGISVTELKKLPQKPVTELWGTEEDAIKNAKILNISLDDYKAQVVSDATGVPYTSEEEKKLAKQQWADQMSLEWTKLNQQNWERDVANANQASASVWQQMAAQTNPDAYPALNVRGNQEAYEKARQDILGSLEPTDWVQRYMVTNKPNPFAGNESITNVAEQQDAEKFANDKVVYLNGLIRNYESKIKDPANPLINNADTINTMQALKAQRDYYQDQLDMTKAVSVMGVNDSITRLMEEQNISYSQALYMARDYAANPNDNKWNTQMNPEELNKVKQAAYQFAAETGMFAKQSEPKALDIPDFMSGQISGNPSSVKWGSKLPEAITPSGQFMNSTNTTQKNLWANYVGQSGQNPQDLVDQMNMQLPKTLNLGKRWSTVTQ